MREIRNARMRDMSQKSVVRAIDQAMSALEAARKELLAGEEQGAQERPARAGKALPLKTSGARRVMSEEGRQRIAEAQRKRWAVAKRAAKKAARLATR